MRIVFTPLARDQFLSALAYIRSDKPSAAVSFRQKAKGFWCGSAIILSPGGPSRSFRIFITVK